MKMSRLKLLLYLVLTFPNMSTKSKQNWLVVLDILKYIITAIAGALGGAAIS